MYASASSKFLTAGFQPNSDYSNNFSGIEAAAILNSSEDTLSQKVRTYWQDFVRKIILWIIVKKIICRLLQHFAMIFSLFEKFSNS